MTRGPNYLSRLLLMQRRSSSSLSLSWMSEFRTLSLRLIPATLQRNLILAIFTISFFWSPPTAHDHRYGWKCRSTSKLSALPSGLTLFFPTMDCYRVYISADVTPFHLSIPCANFLSPMNTLSRFFHSRFFFSIWSNICPIDTFPAENHCLKMPIVK